MRNQLASAPVMSPASASDQSGASSPNDYGQHQREASPPGWAWMEKSSCHTIAQGAATGSSATPSS